jgi:hypothetical protein
MQIGKNFAYALNGTGYGQLNRDVMQWSGRAIDIFQGRYEGSEFSVGGGASRGRELKKTSSNPKGLTHEKLFKLSRCCQHDAGLNHRFGRRRL